MILSATTEERQAALDELLPMQISDFDEVFAAMTGYAVTIRLLDPPLHEFLPNLVEQSLLVKGLEDSGSTGSELDEARELLGHVKRLSEMNPMLGTRGVRLSLLYPEIAEMQTKAILRAGIAVKARGLDPHIEIMVPLVAWPEELLRMREIIVRVADAELAAAGVSDLDYTVGTMIELPSAALQAGKIAEYADFVSFGTNDLTQTALGISRDDAEASFLAAYLEAGIVEKNPFETVHADSVGELVRQAIQSGRATKPTLKAGVCGEHGGDPESIGILAPHGLNYVSCSPFRVPLARLAAAQLAIGGIVKDA
jgi:pyruvate,orthophosphate dikinase